MTKVDLSPVALTLRHAKPGYLVLALIMIIAKTGIQALRTQLLLNRSPSDFAGLFNITCLQSSLVYLVPMGIGEFSFVFLVKKFYHIVLAEGFMIFFVARCTDFFISLFLVVLAVLKSSHQVADSFFWIAAGMAGFLVGVMIFLVKIAQTDQIQNLLSKWRANNSGRISRLIAAWGFKVVEVICYVFRRKIFSLLIIYSAVMWGCVYFFLYFIVHALGKFITLSNAVTLSAINVPLMLLPVKGFGNLGNHEIGWVTALRFFGFNHENALTTAVEAHLIILICILILGLWGMLSLILIPSEIQG